MAAVALMLKDAFGSGVAGRRVNIKGVYDYASDAGVVRGLPVSVEENGETHEVTLTITGALSEIVKCELHPVGFSATEVVRVTTVTIGEASTAITYEVDKLAVADGALTATAQSPDNDCTLYFDIEAILA